MHFKISMFLVMLAVTTSCAQNKIANTISPQIPAKVNLPSRVVASDKDVVIDLKNIYSMQRSYWTDKSLDKEYFGKFTAFVFKDNMQDEGNARLAIYVDHPDNSGDMKLLIDNNKFIRSGMTAGTEPSLSINRKNSILIESGNQASGRNIWSETVTARILASSGKIEVVGYDFTTFDKHMETDGYTCSYNFLTGKAVASITVAKNGKTVARKVKGIKKTIDLNDWSSESRPMDCIPTK